MARFVTLLTLLFVPVGLAGGSDASAATGDNQATANLNQAQILHILVWANKAEIEDGKVAQAKASHAKVKELAAHMVADHTAALEKIDTLATKMGWKPEDNVHSQEMEKDHQAAKARLASVDGMSFDREYVELQEKMHKHLLELIDTKLLPNATDPNLRNLIMDLRPTIAAHLDHAQQLEAEVKAMN